jgi:hypothetical protein
MTGGHLQTMKMGSEHCMLVLSRFRIDVVVLCGVNEPGPQSDADAGAYFKLSSPCKGNTQSRLIAFFGVLRGRAFLED